MRTRLVATLAIIVALIFGSSATAAAKPYQAQTKSVTYSIGVKSGNGGDSVINFQAGFGMTWRMTTAPWTQSVQLSKGSMPNVYVYSRARDYKWPTYVCKVYVNGVLKVSEEGYGGVQCLQSYEY
jgi:hypothetical protein